MSLLEEQAEVLLDALHSAAQVGLQAGEVLSAVESAWQPYPEFVSTDGPFIGLWPSY